MRGRWEKQRDRDLTQAYVTARSEQGNRRILTTQLAKVIGVVLNNFQTNGTGEVFLRVI